jgi:hypothetical protein
VKCIMTMKSCDLGIKVKFKFMYMLMCSSCIMNHKSITVRKPIFVEWQLS